MKKNIYLKNTLRLFKTVYLTSTFLWLLTGYSSVNAQNSENTVLLPKTYEIDSVIIRARKESRNLMEKPYTEPNSLLPSISKVSHEDIRKQGATNVVEAMNYIPGNRGLSDEKK